MKLLIAGDFCPCGRVSSIVEHGDYDSVLGQVKEVLDKADYAVVNLECPVVEHAANPIDKNGPSLHCSRRGAEALKWAGFGCVTLANNHFFDYGMVGVRDTLAACRDLGIDTVGGGNDLQEASQTHYKEIDGKRLAVINCCEHEFSIATETTGGCNPLNPIQQYYAIREARRQSDHVVVIVHGGHEHFQLPSPRMIETYRFFVDAGADVVINHHQHCFSGYELYHGCPIFYGLGNFCFDNKKSRDSLWNYGYMVVLDLSENQIEFSIHPYRQCSDKVGIELLAQDSLSQQLIELNSTLQNPEKLSDIVGGYYRSCSSLYSTIFEPIQNRFYFSAKKRGILPSLISKKHKLRAANYILCESHRDKLSWYLENK